MVREEKKFHVKGKIGTEKVFKVSIRMLSFVAIKNN